MAFKLGRSVFMFLGQGGVKEGLPENPERAFIIFVSARDIASAQKEADAALADRGWSEVDILRGAEVKDKPAQSPHDDAWEEARKGKRGIIIYDTASHKKSNETD